MERGAQAPPPRLFSLLEVLELTKRRIEQLRRLMNAVSREIKTRQPTGTDWKEFEQVQRSLRKHQVAA